MQQQNKELFESYEIKSWEFTPRIYKIIGASLLVNLLFVVVAGQTNLTRKGCDSPFVSRICEVIDTVYVGSIIFGADHDFVVKDYQKTELEDADITYIDVSSDVPPLKYPEGYFALANPNEFAAMQNPDFSTMPTDMSGFPTNPTISNGADLMNTPQVVPTPNDNAVKGTIPESPFSFGGANPTMPKTPPYRPGKIRNYTPKPPKIKNDSPKTLPTDEELAGKPKESKDKAEDKEAVKTQEPVNSEPVSEVEINKKPIQDLGVFVSDLLDKKQINLETAFSVEAKSKLTKEGRLDPKTFKFTQAVSNDPKMIEVVKESIEAINDSGYLQYLKDLSGKDLSLLLQQDDLNLTATVQSELESENKARSIKSALNLAIIVAKARKTDPNDKDDLELLKNATIENDGKKIIIKFAIPKAIAQDMIKRKLLDEAKKAEPNSTAQSINANSKTSK